MCPSFLPGSRPCLFLFFCGVGFADSACPMTFGRVADSACGDTCQAIIVIWTSRCCSQCGQHQETTKYTTGKRIRSSGRWSVGAKRNLTILLASGQYCVNFDDDDLYSDRYVECMVTAMQRRNFVALTLSGWHNLKLCQPDSVRATKFRQLLRSSRLRRIFGTQIMGSIRSE